MTDQVVSRGRDCPGPFRFRGGHERFARIMDGTDHCSNPAKLRLREPRRFEGKPSGYEFGDLPALLIPAQNRGDVYAGLPDRGHEFEYVWRRFCPRLSDRIPNPHNGGRDVAAFE